MKLSRPPSSLEQLVIEIVWQRGSATADGVREALYSARPLKDSTVRTVLKRLEEKGYLHHTVEGRTYVYSGSEPRQNAAVRAVSQIVDRLCNGSVESLLVGMVDHEVIDTDDLERLVKRLKEQRAAARPARRAGR
ncbi:MAG: BlaI/MecI/CopY family transcriptional regulator [Bryobacteraceae bacterium]